MNGSGLCLDPVRRGRFAQEKSSRATTSLRFNVALRRRHGRQRLVRCHLKRYRPVSTFPPHLITGSPALAHRLKTTDELSYDKGISLLSIKNDLLLSYLHHLTLLAHVKLSGRPLAQHADLVQELVRIRVIFDKIRPLESKLKYQIDKLVRKVQVGAVEDEDVVNGTLSLFTYILTSYSRVRRSTRFPAEPGGAHGERSSIGIRL